MSWKTPLVRAIAGVVSRRYAVVRQLLREREVVERVLADPRLLKDLFGAKGAMRPVFEDAPLRESLGLDRSAAEWVDPAAVLRRLSHDEFLTLLKQAEASGLVEAADVTAQFGLDAICDTLPLERVIERFGIGPVLECLPAERIVAYLGVERICEILGVDPIVEHLGLEALLDALVKAHTLKKVMKDAVAPRVAAHDDTDSLLAVFLDRAPAD